MKLSTQAIKSVTSLALLGSLALVGCSASNASDVSATTGVSSSAATPSGDTAASSSAGASDSATVSASATTISYDTHYDSDDLDWDESTEVEIDLSNPTATEGVTVENGVITISADGNYRLTGTLSDGEVVVEAGDDDVIRLILDNASITNSDGSALNIQNADEVIVYTASGTTNTLSDGDTYAATGESDPDATLFSRADLTLAGEGSLEVSANYADGIATRDGLTIVSGNYTVTAVQHGIKGKDYVDILDGTINVTAESGDGIKSTNDTDSERGWVRMNGGAITISAGDDGFKAERELEINGGKLTVTQSYEGIEAQFIMVNGGEVTVTSSDDAMNATIPSDSTSTETTASGTEFASGAEAASGQQGQAPAGGNMGGGQPPADMGGQLPEMPADGGSMGGAQPGGGMPAGGGMGGMEEVVDASITISGGTVNLTTTGGDGFDSNGTASITGGTLIVNGPNQGGNGVFDTAGEFRISGGTILAGGTADMFVAPTTEGQGYIRTTNLSTSQGDTVTVLDSSGETVATYTVTDQGTQLFFASATGITAGETYTLQVNGSEAGTVTAE